LLCAIFCLSLIISLFSFNLVFSTIATPNNHKHKRQTITLEEKQSIIEASKTKPKLSDLITHFNNKYGDSTIRKIIDGKNEIQKAIDDGAGGKRGTLKGAKHSKLERSTF
jgi:hypothetical protein